MNKLELISALKAEANISKAEAAKVVQIFFDKMIIIDFINAFLHVTRFELSVV